MKQEALTENATPIGWEYWLLDPIVATLSSHGNPRHTDHATQIALPL
jgi:hypothetical protein